MPKVNFKRKSTLEIEDLDIEDGSLIYDYETGNTFMDYQNKRIQTGGKPNQDIYIGPEEEAPSEAKIIIDSNKMQTKASEVVNSLEGNETDKAPSVQTINNEFSLIKGQILWTNPNPTNEMSAGAKISLSSADYDMLEVIFVDNVASAEKGTLSVRMIKGYNWRLSNIVNNVMTYRLITRNSDTEFTVGNGFAGTEIQERRCVPLYVMGYKTGLFSKEVNE